MWRGSGPAAALMVVLGLAMAVPAEAQERADRDERRCVCVVRSGNVERPADVERTADRCTCIAWPDSVMTQQVREAMARSGVALERARAELERLRLDTIHVFRHLQPSVRLGLEFSPRPVEGRPGGVRVVGVTRGSGSQEAGLRSGDVIVEVNGHDLSRPLPDERLEEGEESPAAQRLRALTADLEEGDTLRVVYLRNGERRTVEVEARRLDPWRSVRIRGFPGGAWEGPDLRFQGDTILVWPPRGPRAVQPFVMPGVGRFGLRLMDLNPELGAYFGRDEGVLVLEVRDDAPLELRPGDVILRIDGRKVEDARHATSILQSYRSGENIRVEVLRRGQTEAVEGRVR